MDDMRLISSRSTAENSEITDITERGRGRENKSSNEQSRNKSYVRMDR